jgi:hypothetical protein
MTEARDRKQFSDPLEQPDDDRLQVGHDGIVADISVVS